MHGHASQILKEKVDKRMIRIAYVRKGKRCCFLQMIFLYRLQGLAGEICGGLAQLGERLLCTQEVSGSIPLISTHMGR